MRGGAQSARAFFERYATAFEAFDAPAVAAQFVVPCLFVRDGATTVAAEAGAVETSVRELLTLHKAWDVQTIAPDAVVLLEDAPGHAIARVDWRLGRTRSKLSWSFSTTYTLVPSGDGDWRIAAAVTHDAPF